ncbi:nucleotide-diphospho-sugar transferase [Obelidium mucronatum]|nr:nucleotide-diphospho-sugar transferase [Obelidium mucronatum]
MGLNAFATLVTSDSYLRGACALQHSLKRSGTLHEIVALVPPSGLSSGALATLYRVFDRIIYVPLWTNTGDKENLQLLGRPELDITYTKLHVFDPSVLPFERVCFVDADAFAMTNVDSVFSALDSGAYFAAAADVGWPDLFNSGVFVCRPNETVFAALKWAAKYTGSFDGGDQGLLNRFFDTWVGFDRPPLPSPPADAPPPPHCPCELKRAARLPFSFNVTPSAVYSYLVSEKFLISKPYR